MRQRLLVLLALTSLIATVIALCDALLDEQELRAGVAGQVREALFANLGRDIRLPAVCERLKISPRTLRRQPLQEGTSFQEIADHLRQQLAMKYLRDTDVTVEDIAFALGFSDAANSRRAFRAGRGGHRARRKAKRVRTIDAARIDFQCNTLRTDSRFCSEIVG
jgi:AraC-like DNA-binding protein